jgi:hypothetical protein
MFHFVTPVWICSIAIVRLRRMVVNEEESWEVGELGSWGGIAITSLGKACHLFAALMPLACCASVIENKVGELESWRVGEE